MRKISFVSCTAGAKEETQLYRSLRKLEVEDFEFREGNRAGLSECYNQWLDKYAGEDRILVLVHSDVTVTDVFYDEKLSTAAEMFDIVGLIGASQFTVDINLDHYAWPIWPAEHLSGGAEHVVGKGVYDWYRYGPTPRECVVMDGLFLAVDMRKIGGMRFDPQFTFHLYDLDFCLAAHRARLRMGTTNVYVQHASEGNFKSAEYQEARKRFREKWTMKGVAGGH